MPRATITDSGVAIDLESDEPGATQAELDAYIDDSLGGFTIEQLHEAFGAVQDKEHWKNPIDAVVARDRVEVLTRAIPFMTGTFADFDDVGCAPGMIRVTAPGYFAGPCN